MKLNFWKKENSEISISITIDNDEHKFSYPVFVQRIYEGDLPIETEFSEDITKEEAEKLKAMIKEIENVSIKKEETYTME